MNGHSRGGAPAGNMNATKSGLKGSKLPPGCKVESGHVQRLVRRVKSEYEAKHGPMTAHADAILHRIRRAAVKDRLAARWLRLEDGKLSIEQRMQLADAMTAAAETIEKCLRLLKLDGDSAAADPMADLRELLCQETPQSPPAARNQPETPETTPAAIATPERGTGKATTAFPHDGAPQTSAPPVEVCR